MVDSGQSDLRKHQSGYLSFALFKRASEVAELGWRKDT
jgi:hypothetical protein